MHTQCGENSHRCSECKKSNEFAHLVRMISALPFAPPDFLDDVFILLTSKARGIKDPKLKEFSMSLVQYADEQWRQGVFSKQDWNLYDINLSHGAGDQQWKRR